MFKMGSFNLLVFLPIFLSLHLYSSALETELIVGGSLTPHCQLKYQLSLQFVLTICGGAIINENYAVTAAHCVLKEHSFTPRRIKIFAGASNLKNPTFQTNISKIFLHSDYLPDNAKSDLAVIKVNPPFVFNSKSCMAKVDLPSNASDTFLDQNVTLSGFGYTRPEDQKIYREFDKLITSKQLFQLPAKVKSNEQCQSLWNNYADNFEFGAIPRKTIEDTFICAEAYNATKYEPKGSCKIDEGGAFVTSNNVLAGIGILNPFGCNNYLAPAVGIRVTSYLPFIQKVLNNDYTCKVVSTEPYETCVVS